MIRLDSSNNANHKIEEFSYISKRNFWTRFVLGTTRRLRANHALKYIIPKERHLDIGCGDGYFLKRSRCRERYGLDLLLGDDISKGLSFSDNFFDYVTMLAVIEHLEDPKKVMNEIWRVLKPQGRLIITTPNKIAEKFISLYMPNVKDEHKEYFDLEKIKKIASDRYLLIGHHEFLFWLNQAFCLEKM